MLPILAGVIVALAALLAALAVFRAEQIKIGYAPEFTNGTGYVFNKATTVGSYTKFPNEIIDGFDTLEELDVKTIKVRGQNTGFAQREAYQLVTGKRFVEDSFRFAVQNGLWLAFALGKDTQGGTDKGGGLSTTLNANSTVGATTITVPSTLNLAVGDYIRIGVVADREVRKVASFVANTSITFNDGLRYAHTSGDAVVELDETLAFTNTLKPYDLSPWPSAAVELDFLDASNLSLYLTGLSVDSLTLTGGEEDVIYGTCNFKASRFTRNAGALSSIVPDTTEPYKFLQGSVTLFGSVVARVQDWTATISNGGKLKHYHDNLTAPYPKEYLAAASVYTMETTVIANDSTFFDLLKGTAGQAQGSMSVSLLYTRAANDLMQLDFSNAALPKAPHRVPEEAEVPVSLSLIPRNMSATFTRTPLSSFDPAFWV